MIEKGEDVGDAGAGAGRGAGVSGGAAGGVEMEHEEKAHHDGCCDHRVGAGDRV